MVLSMMGLIVAGGSKLMGFDWFGVWFLVLCNGSRWVAGWVLGRFWWGFGLWWVARWLAVVVFIFGRFQWFWVWVCFIVLFYVTPKHNVEYFPEHFSKIKTNTEKKKKFEIIYILKHFTFTSKQIESYVILAYHQSKGFY